MDDLISRQAAIDALDVLCQEHRYKIPGKRETYSQYNEAWQDALDRAEGAIFNLPSAQPEVLAHGEGELSAQTEIILCKDCKHRPTSDEDGWLDFPTERCPCQNEDDFYYSWMPKDDWFCGNAERQEE